MAIGLVVGLVAGAAMRSRWAMLAAPAAFIAVFELVRLGSIGPTVDAISFDGIYGWGALAVGRGFHGLLAVVPLLVGAALGRAWARRRWDPQAPPEGWGRAGLVLRRAGTVVVGLALLVLAAGIVRPASTEAITGPDGEQLDGSIAELATVELGGHEQVMLVRGASADNPVLLFLAGGPGGFEIGTMSRHARLLEQDFVVVTWEQRGTGKSYGSFEPGSTLTFDGAVDDTIELSEHLRERFDTEAIYLVGNSYGTLLGAEAAERRPDLFAALVGAGQMVDVTETDRLFYEDTLAHAERNGDTALVDRLVAQGPPPYDDPADYLPLVEGEHQWNDYSDLEGHQGRREPTENLAVSEYGLVDQVRALSGLVDTYAVLYPQIQGLDLRADVPRLEVPVHLVQGRYEARGRAEPALEWFERLEAPSKDLTVFELSGHRPFVEEPERFAEVMRDVAAQVGRS
jgi:proline iminopeptidase